MEIKCSTVRILSIDIGIQNFAYYIEDVDIPCLQRIASDFRLVPFKFRKLCCNDYTRPIIDALLLSGRCIDFCVTQLAPQGTSFCDTVRKNTISFLKSKDIFETVDFVVIEAQYIKRGSANFDALKLAETVFTFFVVTFPAKEVFSFPSKYKTLCFQDILHGYTHKKTKKQRKTFTVDLVLYMGKDLAALVELHRKLFRKRNRNIKELIKGFEKEPHTKRLAEQIILNKQKLDDVCDAKIQCQAFKFVLISNKIVLK